MKLGRLGDCPPASPILKACHLARSSPCIPTPLPAAAGSAAPAPSRHAVHCGWPPPAPAANCVPVKAAAAHGAATASTSTLVPTGGPSPCIPPHWRPSGLLHPAAGT